MDWYILCICTVPAFGMWLRIWQMVQDPVSHLRCLLWVSLEHCSAPWARHAIHSSGSGRGLPGSIFFCVFTGAWQPSGLTTLKWCLSSSVLYSVLIYHIAARQDKYLDWTNGPWVRSIDCFFRHLSFWEDFNRDLGIDWPIADREINASWEVNKDSFKLQ